MTGSFGEGIPIPDVIDPPESMEMTLCIPKNRDHMVAFFGALYQLTIWNSWEQDGTQHGKELAAVWWRYYLSWERVMNDNLCEDDMGNCCTEPAITKRVNPTTGQMEQSTNNGQTWTPLAGGFPSIIVQPVPPVTSGVAATKCDAATNVSGQVQVWIDQVSNDFTTAVSLLEFGQAVILAIAGAVLTVLTAGALAPLEALYIAAIGAALVAAWGAGKAVFDAYWTTDIKDKIFCDAFCNIGEDGSFTDIQFSGFWNDVNHHIPPSPAKMLFMGFLSSVGKEGLNAMAASGTSADGDCADCDCVEGCNNTWSVFASTPNYFGIIVHQTPTYVIVKTDVINTNGIYYTYLTSVDNSHCCVINHVTYVLHTTDESLMTYENMLANGEQVGNFGADCGSAIPTESMGPKTTDNCMNQVQFQSATQFAIMYLKDDC